jgi:putative flavoprotein involved in K+ transport
MAAEAPAAVVDLFEPEGCWRDMVAFTWNIATFEGRQAIAAMLAATRSRTVASGWRPDGPATVNGPFVEQWLRFQTAAGSGRAHLRLREGRAHTFLTSLTALTGHPWAEGRNRPHGLVHGYQPGRKSSAASQSDRVASYGDADQPEVVIIGGGQGAMALGARLKSLGVSALILERKARPGDSWRDRYESLTLHDPVWYDHMPYIPFPAGWPVFSSKDQMADWLEMYAKVMALDYWTGTEVVSARRQGAHWSVTARQADREITLTPRQLVFATGMSGYPRIPNIPGAADFKGSALHSCAYRTGADHVGARAVVIGANTSAHDICQDLVEQGAQATMVQRSSTLVASSQSVVDLLLGPLYSEEALARGITHEDADFIASTWPWALMAERTKPLAAEMARRDAHLLDRLRARGFQLDRGEDGAGIPMKSARRGGGFYIDAGASGMIADGRIGLASGVEAAHIEPDAVVLSDGRRLPCDLIVYATGYHSMHHFIGDICGADVGAQVGRVWGLGSGLDGDPGPWRGELRNMWKPTGVAGLWLQGGNLAQSRHYSRFLALQLKARLGGMATPVYGQAPAD